MILQNIIDRPDWVIGNQSTLVDLSNNVCFDHILANDIRKSMMNMDPSYVINYANEFDIYKTIGDYYNIDRKLFSIGVG